MIYLSGQTAAYADYRVIHKDIAGQAHAVYDNIETALKAVQAGLANIVKTTTYLVDPAHIAAVRDVRIERYRGLEAPPANTLLIVNRLAEPEMLIEIDVIAAVPLPP